MNNLTNLELLITDEKVLIPEELKHRLQKNDRIEENVNTEILTSGSEDSDDYS